MSQAGWPGSTREGNLGAGLERILRACLLGGAEWFGWAGEQRHEEMERWVG